MVHSSWKTAEVSGSYRPSYPLGACLFNISVVESYGEGFLFLKYLAWKTTYPGMFQYKPTD